MKLTKKNIEKILLLLAILILFLVVYFYKDQVLQLLINISTFLGLSGIFLIGFILDIIFFQPISPSVFLVLILLSDQFEWYFVYLAITLGSLCGSYIDYFLGKYYGEKIFSLFFSKKKLHKAEKLFEKYSHYAILIGAFTPVPFSLICWVAGMSHVPFKKFFVFATISRATLFMIYTILVSFGVLSFIM